MASSKVLGEDKEKARDEVTSGMRTGVEIGTEDRGKG
jgi:hypothetical protein